MRITRALAATVTVLVVIGYVGPLSFPTTAFAETAKTTSNVAVGPQYDTTHVYVAPGEFDTFVASLVATFGGTTSKKGVFTVTPTPSKTMSQLVLTPVGTISVFGFETPIPYPFGAERTGYLVTDMDSAIRAAHATGADILVSRFPDPIGLRCSHTMAGWGEHTALLAHGRSVLCGPPEHPRKPCLCVRVCSESFHQELSGVLSRRNGIG